MMKANVPAEWTGSRGAARAYAGGVPRETVTLEPIVRALLRFHVFRFPLHSSLQPSPFRAASAALPLLCSSGIPGVYSLPRRRVGRISGQAAPSTRIPLFSFRSSCLRPNGAVQRILNPGATLVPQEACRG